MTEEMEKYYCESCGTIIEVIQSGEGELVCCDEPMQLYDENSDIKSKKLEEFEEEIETIETFTKEEKVNENRDRIYTFIDSFLHFIGTYSHNFEDTPAYKKLIHLFEDVNYLRNMKEIIALCRVLLNNLKSSLTG